MKYTPSGEIYVADTLNHAIRRIDPEGNVTTVAGDGSPGKADGQGPGARFNLPTDIVLLPDGDFLISDTLNHRIRRMTSGGLVTTETGGVARHLDGPLEEALFDQPGQLILDRNSSNIYVADNGTRIRKIDGNKVVSTVVPEDSLKSIHVGDEATEDALISAIALDQAGRLLFTEYYSGILYEWTGENAYALAGFGSGDLKEYGELIRFNRPTAMAVQGDEVFVVEKVRFIIVKVTTQAPAREAFQRNEVPSPLYNTSFSYKQSEEDYRWPVIDREKITAYFGEVRGKDGDNRDHFHNGIDFDGRNDKDLIRAVDDMKFLESRSISVAFRSDNNDVDWLYVHTKVNGTSALANPPTHNGINYFAVEKNEEFSAADTLPIKIFEKNTFIS